MPDPDPLAESVARLCVDVIGNQFRPIDFNAPGRPGTLSDVRRALDALELAQRERDAGRHDLARQGYATQQAEHERDQQERFKFRANERADLAEAERDAWKAKADQLAAALRQFARHGCTCSFTLAETTRGADCRGECPAAIAESALADAAEKEAQT